MMDRVALVWNCAGMARNFNYNAMMVTMRMGMVARGIVGWRLGLDVVVGHPNRETIATSIPQLQLNCRS